MIIQTYTPKAKQRAKIREQLPVVDDEYIMRYFYSSGGKRLNKSKLINIPDFILRYLNNRYKDSSCLEETLQRIKLHCEIHPICPICGNLCKYVGGTRFFIHTCGNKECSIVLNQQHLKETCLARYGVTNAAKTDESKAKQKKTNIQKYKAGSPLLNKKIHKKQ